MNKKDRHTIIKKIIESNAISSQEELLSALLKEDCNITQATLSRDMKELGVVKAPSKDKSYIYHLPSNFNAIHTTVTDMPITASTSCKIEFSGQLAVIKTRPGYAMAIAGEIDSRAQQTILGTVAGDDTILIIPRENYSREEIIDSLSEFINFYQ